MTLHTLIALALVCTGLAAAGLLRAAITRRHQAGGPGLILLSSGLVVWTLSNAAQTVSTTRWIKDLTLSVTFTAIYAVTIGCWWCITALTRRPRMTPRRWALLAVPVPITLGLVWTRFGGLMFDEVLIPAGQGPVDNVPGPWYPVSVIWSYALIGGSLALFAATALRSGGRFRHQGGLLLGALALPLSVNVIAVTRFVEFRGYDPTPVTILVTVAGIAWGIRRLGLFDVQIGLLPIAPRVVVAAMQDGVAVIDGSGRVLDLNPAARTLLGVDHDAAATFAAKSLLPGWSDRRGDGVWRATVGERAIEVTMTSIDPDDASPSRVAIIRDITERRHAEEALAESSRRHRHQALHDPLTGLPNRSLLFDRLRQAMLQERPAGERLSLMILDLDGFKELNDGFGHRAGDAVLREIAARLLAVLPDTATVARLAGDEFAVLLTSGDDTDAQHRAYSVAASLRTPFRIEGRPVPIGVSIGIAFAPDHGNEPDELVHAADVAMYQAKRTSAGVAVFGVGGDGRRPERLLLRQQIREAITAGDLLVHYQPLYSAGGDLVCLEALVRWSHPTRGLVVPDEFLAIAEASDLVLELTDYVLDVAASDADRWNLGHEDVRIAVNISSRDLADPNLAARVSRVLHRHGVPPNVLTLEISENSVASTRDAYVRLAAIRASGVRVSLDDFGTGLAPLSTLRDLAVDEIKVDQSFVREIATNTRDGILTGGLIRLAHELGIEVVAEGVETVEAADVLAELGCDVLQGYLWGPPAPLDSLESVRHPHGVRPHR